MTFVEEITKQPPVTDTTETQHVLKPQTQPVEQAKQAARKANTVAAKTAKVLGAEGKHLELKGYAVLGLIALILAPALGLMWSLQAQNSRLQSQIRLQQQRDLNRYEGVYEALANEREHLCNQPEASAQCTLLTELMERQ